MKWNIKCGTLGDFDTYKARYKNFSINVQGASNTFKLNLDFYYFLVDNSKLGITYNSLWSEMKFQKLEEAQAASVKWIDEKLKSMKD